MYRRRKPYFALLFTVALIVGAFAVGLSAVHKSDDSLAGYISTDATHIGYVQFSSKSGRLTGIYTQDEFPADITNDLSEKALNFTGTKRNSKLTITFKVVAKSETWTGKLIGDTLNVTYDQGNGVQHTAFRKTTYANYQAALAKLRLALVDARVPTR